MRRESHFILAFRLFLSPAVQTAFNLIKTSLYFFNEKEKLKEEFYKLRSNNYDKGWKYLNSCKPWTWKFKVGLVFLNSHKATELARSSDAWVTVAK